jgi:pimeloyl-ACP methyl ester carboxylesterase
VATLTTFDGLRLHYCEEGSGEPVLLLHGLTSSTEGNWRRPGIWSLLVDHGRRVIGLDARGHGKSEKPHDPTAYENAAMVRDVAALLDELVLTQVDLVGYSMGALTAIRFAAKDRRVRRLVLGGIGGDPQEWGTPEHLAARRARADRILVGLEADDPETLTDPLARRVRSLMEQRGNDLEAMAAIQKANRPLGGELDVRTVTAPTLVICGDNDVAAAPLADALPDGHAHVLPGDHESVVGDAELAKVITAFVTEPLPAWDRSTK